MSESPYDAFGGGHASVSISAAFGMAKAAELKGEQRQVVAVIGDGSMTGGLAFEGLNNAGASPSRPTCWSFSTITTWPSTRLPGL